MFLIISPLIIDHTRTETKIFEHTLTLGATCPGPQTSRGPQLEKYPKIEQSPIKVGANTRH